jgi:hypothetical protein
MTRPVWLAKAIPLMSSVITLHALLHLGCHADFGNGVMDLQASGGGLSGGGKTAVGWGD